MNLLLYIPKHSAHSKNTIQSLIYGLLHTYKRQNPNIKDFNCLANLLFKRLKIRGRQTNDLITNFKDALSCVEKRQQQTLLLFPSTQNPHNPPHHSQPSQTLSPSPTPPTNRNQQTQQKSNLPPDNQIFFHLQYHPRGVTRHTIQQTYISQCTTTSLTNKYGFDNMPNDTTGGTLAIKKLTIDYHRPTNLRDILCPSTLQEHNDTTVSTITSDLTK